MELFVAACRPGRVFPKSRCGRGEDGEARKARPGTGRQESAAEALADGRGWEVGTGPSCRGTPRATSLGLWQRLEEAQYSTEEAYMRKLKLVKTFSDRKAGEASAQALRMPRLARKAAC